jgi:Fuc2NAc and GlcNAc transferase
VVNSGISLFLLLILAFLGCYFFTGFLRRYALANQLVDHPNSRSSHRVPTPRGGGVAIVLSLTAVMAALTFTGWISCKEMFGIGGAGLLVATIGWMDDKHHVSVRIRLLIHFLAAAWGVFWLGIFTDFNNMPLFFQGVVYACGLIFLVWLLNLYNFMDGIDGLASIEAITLGGAFFLLAAYSGVASSTAIISLALMACVAGFILWNFPTAKIFMGDAGSGFLGLVLGLLSLNAALVKIELFWSWVILLGVFIVDASYTLARRILTREKFYEAHCTHAYQHAARRYASHVRVSLGCGLINLLWLLPIAFLVSLEMVTPVIGVAVAYLPLILLAAYFKAGQAVQQSG